MDWTKHYPAFKEEEEKSDEGSTPYKNVPSVTNIIKKVEIADIGCGFGGLLFALAPKLSDTLILGPFLLLIAEVNVLTFHFPRHGNS